MLLPFLIGLIAGLADVYLMNRFFNKIVSNIRGLVTPNDDDKNANQSASAMSFLVAIVSSLFRWLVVAIIVALGLFYLGVSAVIPMVVGLIIPIFIAFAWRAYKSFQE